MQSVVQWVKSDLPPDDDRDVLIALDGSVTVGWFGGDGMWRVGTTYSSDPQWWAELPLAPRPQ